MRAIRQILRAACRSIYYQGKPMLGHSTLRDKPADGWTRTGLLRESARSKAYHPTCPMDHVPSTMPDAAPRVQQPFLARLLLTA